MKTILLQGSSRTNGNTSMIASLLQRETQLDIVHLSDFKIGHYSFDNTNVNDSFLPLINRIADDYDMIIFATPVYCFTMSGVLKVFYDRLFDIVKRDKQLGRRLRGKYVAALSCSSGNDEFNGFFQPIKMSSKYLGMNYIGDIHTWVGDCVSDEVKLRINDFGRLLETINNSN